MESNDAIYPKNGQTVISHALIKIITNNDLSIINSLNEPYDADRQFLQRQAGDNRIFTFK